MIDIHSHIVWGVDDGPQERSQSLAMLKMAAATGTTDIVATPHSDSQFAFDGKLVAERIQELASATGNVPRIHSGCDFHFSFENVRSALEDPPQFTINGLNHLMVEFADNVPPSSEEILRRFATEGIVPIITHPERNPVLQNSHERLAEWIQIGCLLQVTAQSLTGRFGKTAEQAAWGLLRKGLVHVVASDAHDTEDRPPRLDQARDILTAEMGADAASLLLEENPSAVIRGERVWMAAASSAPAKKRKWFWPRR
jgi:protein-tyrosine phosphatase